MALIYITGVEGSGKSAVCKELHKLGFESHDMDDEGIACIHSKETGLPDKDIPDYKKRTADWTAQHSWRIIDSKMQKLAKSSNDNTVFLCGTADNEEDYLLLFNQVIALYAEPEVVIHRMLTRTGKNNYGKAPFEQQIVLDKYKTATEKYDRMHAIVIDSFDSIKNVVSAVLQASDLS